MSSSDVVHFRLEASMCGIAGLFIKTTRLQPELGSLLAAMTSTLCSRGPDSAGFAVYASENIGRVKLTLTSIAEEPDFDALGAELLRALGASVPISRLHTHAVLAVPAHQVEHSRAWLARNSARGPRRQRGRRARDLQRGRLSRRRRATLRHCHDSRERMASGIRAWRRNRP